MTQTDAGVGRIASALVEDGPTPDEDTKVEVFVVRYPASGELMPLVGGGEDHLVGRASAPRLLARPGRLLESGLVQPPMTASVTEAARLLGISRSHAYELVRLGQLPHVRLGRRIVVPRRELEQWVRRQSDGPPLG